MKQIGILKFFIEHFIAVAKTSLKISTTKQTRFYSKQAWYLSKLLEDDRSSEEEAESYQREIQAIELQCGQQALLEPQAAPDIPKRGSLVPANELILNVNKRLNIQNVANSYHSNTAQPGTSGMYSKRGNANAKVKKVMSFKEEVDVIKL